MTSEDDGEEGDAAKMKMFSGSFVMLLSLGFLFSCPQVLSCTQFFPAP
jgi:hypothetical protein